MPRKPTVPTSIVDKNGKKTTVHKKVDIPGVTVPTRMVMPTSALERIEVDSLRASMGRVDDDASRLKALANNLGDSRSPLANEIREILNSAERGELSEFEAMNEARDVLGLKRVPILDPADAPPVEKGPEPPKGVSAEHLAEIDGIVDFHRTGRMQAVVALNLIIRNIQDSPLSDGIWEIVNRVNSHEINAVDGIRKIDNFLKEASRYAKTR